MKNKMFLFTGLICLGVAQANGATESAIAIKTLSCSPASSGHIPTPGMRYAVRIVTRSAISGSGARYFLLSKILSPDLNPGSEEVFFHHEQGDTIALAGKASTITLLKDYSSARVDFSDGSIWLCK